MNTYTNFNGNTKLLGLLGSPVAHSISPMMHNTAFNYLGLNYVYLCFDVDTSSLEAAVKGLRTLNVRGFNLTFPDKSEVIKYLDDISDAAMLSGSVNTVVNDNGAFIGHNTDGLGYFDSLREMSYEISGKTITILGDGGASRAICSQAALSGASVIYICCRTPFKETTIEFSERVMEKTGCTIILKDVEKTADLGDATAASSLVTNTTTVGMKLEKNAGGPSSLITDAAMLSHKPLVSEIIYNPKVTPLMSLAESAGCKTINGLGMLLYQGVHAFKLWTGEDMPVDLIKRTCFKELAN